MTLVAHNNREDAPKTGLGALRGHYLFAVLDLFELGIDDVILRRAGFGTARTTGCSGPGCTCSLCGIRTTLL